MYHPVIGMKTKVKGDEKWLFALCKERGKNFDERCTHTANERTFIGAWTTPKINLGLEKG